MGHPNMSCENLPRSRSISNSSIYIHPGKLIWKPQTEVDGSDGFTFQLVDFYSSTLHMFHPFILSSFFSVPLKKNMVGPRTS